MRLFDLTNRLWERPSVPQVNMLRPRSPLFTWKSEEEARRGSAEPFACPAIESLNGEWHFRLFARPEEVDTRLLYGEIPLRGASLRKIHVPGDWTRQNVGDNPHYVNVCMPFADTPPTVPKENNPCGVYLRKFTVRKGFERLILHFGGIETCAFIHVNGQDVGMVKDSKTASEFDITDFVHADEENTLAILVIRWSDGSFLECQDHWRAAGITRDVYLQYTPKAHIADLFARTTLDEATEKNGILRLRLDAAFRGAHVIPPDWKFRVQIYSADGADPLWDAPKELPFYRNEAMYHYGNPPQPLAEATYELPNVRRWSAETPELYRLTACLVDAEGRVVEATGTDFGFRSVRRKDGCLMINGQPVKFFGVNRHDFDEHTGKTVSPESIRKDLLLMKRLGFNAIRTCHYPNDERLTALANRLGFYVISEANIEIHAYCHHLSDDPLWLSAMMDRFTRMVLIYKNNPCIHLWSLGNEAGRGANFPALAAWSHAFDDSRCVHYCELTRLVREGTWDGYVAHDGEGLFDVVSTMYPPFPFIEDWIQKNMPVESRPFIPCEYTHAMGNSNGSLDRYFDYFRKYRRMQGGYIWDWVDQGLAETDKDGRAYWAYGGDYGEKVHDANFCVNGMVLPNRTPHPACKEFQYLARTFDFAPKRISSGTFLLRNWNYFTTLDGLNFSWRLERDGESVQEGEIASEQTKGLPPQTEREVRIGYDLALIPMRPRQELYLTITARQGAATPWAEAGYIVAEQQFDLTQAVPTSNLGEFTLLPTGRLAFSENTINDGESILHFTDGAMPDRWLFRGKPLLASALHEQFVRGVLDNDAILEVLPEEKYRIGGKWVNQWDLFHGKEAEILATSVQQTDGSLVMRSTAAFQAKNDAVIEISRQLRMGIDGVLSVELEFRVPDELDDLPRLGVTLALPEGFENLHFYGAGPQECYWDRQAAAQIGLYHQRVAEQLFPYVMPQESGNHTRIQAIAVENGEVGLLAVSAAGATLEASALHVTPEELFQARHLNEIVPRKETFLNLDIHQRGLGTASCGQDTVEDCRIHAGWHRLAFRLCPFEVRQLPNLMTLVRQIQR